MPPSLTPPFRVHNGNVTKTTFWPLASFGLSNRIDRRLNRCVLTQKVETSRAFAFYQRKVPPITGPVMRTFSKIGRSDSWYVRLRTASDTSPQ